MPAINFPDTPLHGDEYTNAGQTWVWNSTVPAWEAKIVSNHAPTHATGGADPLTPGDINAATDDHVHIIGILTEATAARSLALTDVGKVVNCIDVGGCTITLPAEGAVAWTIGQEIYLWRSGGALAWSLSGVTIDYDGITELPVGGGCVIKYQGADIWRYAGAVDMLPYATDGVIFDAGTATGDISLDRNNGLYQKVLIGIGNAAPNLLPPAGGNEAETLTMRIKASPGESPVLTFDAAIAIPSDYAGTLPKVLGAGLTYKIKLEYNGTAWELQALVGGYP